MPRRTTSFVELLFESPWWVSVIIAALVYVVMRHVLPIIETDNQMIGMIFQAFAIPAPFIAFLILLIAPFSYFNRRRKAKQLDTQQDLESIRALHWRIFEELVAEAFRRKGYQVTEGGYGADGGIDLELRKDEEVTLVQCKQWKTQKIGVSVVREMFGVLTANDASYVIIICSGKFTQQAKDFASGKQVELIDENSLLSLVKGVQEEKIIETQNTKTCPKCGSNMIIREAKRGSNAGNTFLGCSSFPRCRHTE